MPTVQNQEPIVGCKGFSSEWGVYTAQSTPVNHVDNDTKDKSHVNSQLYCSHSIATSRFRELLLLLSSLLERLWYNYQYIYNINNQFYHLIGITNNKSSDIQPLRQDYLHVPINSLLKITGHHVFVFNDAPQRLKQLHDKGVVEFLVRIDLVKLLHQKNKQRNVKNNKRPESISLGILHKSTSKDNYVTTENLFTYTIKYPLTVEINYPFRTEFKH